MNKISREVQEIDWKVSEAEKSGHDHFMHKEILEQAEVIERTITGRLEIGSEEIPVDLNKAKQFEKIWIVACGTAYHAGLFGKDLFEKVLGVPVSVELASEFRYREPIVGKNDLGIVISQSGETMDLLIPFRLAGKLGQSRINVVNKINSTLARENECGVFLNCGREFSVASTKAFVC
jgi:glucosamine--fructose-6-phosphate aminotransferase (isomerizing)